MSAPGADLDAHFIAGTFLAFFFFFSRPDDADGGDPSASTSRSLFWKRRGLEQNAGASPICLRLLACHQVTLMKAAAMDDSGGPEGGTRAHHLRRDGR